MVRAVLLGLPGSGKSTQAAMMKDYYAVPSVSPGALLREAVRQGTDIGRQVHDYLKRGELAPNHLVDLLLFGRLRQPDCEKGFVLDGFPRTVQQAKALEEFMKQQAKSLDAVLFLEAPVAVVVSRLSARRVCPKCKAIYNLLYHPPQAGDLCYACQTPLKWVGGQLECEACQVPFTLRMDDRSEAIRRRIEVQQQALAPVLTHFQNLGLLVEIDGNRPPKEVFDDIRAVLGGQQQVGGIR